MKACTWWPWKIASAAKSTKITSSRQDITICTVTVMVTPAATAATMRKKKTAPTSVTSTVLFAAPVEKRPRMYEPAGTVAATMKMSAETMSAQPER